MPRSHEVDGVFGTHTIVWNVVTVTLRQQLVPDQLFGRVNSVYKLLAMGTVPLGALLGGFLGRTLGLVLPSSSAARPCRPWPCPASPPSTPRVSVPHDNKPTSPEGSPVATIRARISPR